MINSLRFRLSLWLLMSIAAVAVIGGALSFVLTFNEANELQDDMLRQTAALFDARHLPASGGDRNPQRTDIDPETTLRVALLKPRADAGPPHFPSDLVDGLQTRVLDGQTWRIFVRALGSGERIAVAQQTAVRNEAASTSAILALLPFLVLVPILLLVVAVLVRRIFAPVITSAAAVNQRSERNLQPVAAAGLPREIRPFMVAINRLLRRVADAMAMQQRFIAAAAHELRSPLTALSLQAERLDAATMSPDASQRVKTLRQGIERNRVLLEQLLSYARAQGAPPPALTAKLRMHDLFRRIVADLMPLAEAKAIDIGVAGRDIEIVTAEVELSTAIRNLLANAIQYTPETGAINLEATRGEREISIVIEDSGPGVDPSERERVFEPFHRALGTEVPGSGLGLSIVRTLINRLDGQIELGDATSFSTGLRVTLNLPAKPIRDDSADEC